MIDNTRPSEDNAEIDLEAHLSGDKCVEDNAKINENADEKVIFFPNKTLVELSNTSWSANKKSYKKIQPYLRGCKWSPDGTCCLSVVNSNGQHLLELSSDLYQGSVHCDRPVNILSSVIHVKESGLVYDFCWYPGMDSALPDTCCWLTTKQHSPMQLWDAFDGTLRCSYRGFNAVDEMEPALTVAFSYDGYKIYGGYKKDIKIFDTDRPGRDCMNHKIKSPASCLLATQNLIFVGSWNTTISIYSVNEIGNFKSAGNIYGHSGGITHLKTTPDGTKLISGARKDDKLMIWDLRYFRKPLKILNRPMNTNQRVYFDLTPDGQYLVSGGTDGILRVWDLTDLNTLDDLEAPCLKFPVHKDCCNSVSVHPLRPIVATGSGQFHHDLRCFDDDCEMETEQTLTQDTGVQASNELKSQLQSNEDSSSEDSDGGHEAEAPVCLRNSVPSEHFENSLVFWWIGDVR